jgi:hypothetical protein
MQNILVTVCGGVAEVVEETVPEGMTVEIIDFDNLRDEGEWTPPELSKTAMDYVERADGELAARLKARL